MRLFCSAGRNVRVGGSVPLTGPVRHRGGTSSTGAIVVVVLVLLVCCVCGGLGGWLAATGA